MAEGNPAPAGCTVLMYHVIGDARSDAERRLCCPLKAFEAQMESLKHSGWKVIPLSELVRAIDGGPAVAPRSVCITFDDGTACTYENALPVLQRHGFPATVFVVSGLLGGRNEWMARECHPERAMLTIGQLRALAAGGVEIGSHTVNHVRLAGLDGPSLSREVADSKRRLEDVLGRPVDLFAYPYGSHDAAARQAVRQAGYRGACTTVMGRNRGVVHPLRIERTEIMGDDSMWQFRGKLCIGTHDMPPWSIPRRALKRAVVRVMGRDIGTI